MQQSDDNNNKGCNFTLVYVASGGQHVDRQYVMGDKALEMLKGKNKGVANALPPELSTPKAMELWHKAQQAAELRSHLYGILSVILYSSRSRLQVVSDDVHKRGLPCSVGPEESVDSRRELAGEIVQRGEASVLLGEV